MLAIAPYPVNQRAIQVRTIAKPSLLPVILSGAKNPILSAETLRSAQGDNLPDFAIVLDTGRPFRLFPPARFLTPQYALA